MNNKIMKKNIVLKYKIGEHLGRFGWSEDRVISREELNTEIFTETDKELKVDKNYIIDDIEFIVEEKYFDISNNCFVYQTDIKTVDENLEEKYKLEIELQKIKYEKLQNELNDLKNSTNKAVAVPECNCNCKKKKFPFSLFK